MLCMWCTIGFARQVRREYDLGFGDNYGINGLSINDHAGVVFSDETATVILKTDKMNCKPIL